MLILEGKGRFAKLDPWSKRAEAMRSADKNRIGSGALAVSRNGLIHINNSNPVLDPRSPERAAANAAGSLIGEDGMGFEL